MKNYKTDIVSNISLSEGYKRKLYWVDEVSTCDFCNAPLVHCDFIIDAKQKNSPMWGLFCPNCFEKSGESIGYGKGQIYMRTEDNQWIMVGGFPPEDDF